MSRPALPTAEPPKGPLNRYRLLSPSASLRVSPLCLGAMNFGDAWESFMGACDRKTTEGILDFFYEQGGNFIDTANNYQFEESETYVPPLLLMTEPHWKAMRKLMVTYLTAGLANG